MRVLERRLRRFAEGAPQPSMRAAGSHLAGVIWPESEREYELRCYVRDLTWEPDFYRMAARLSGQENAVGRVHNLGYGHPSLPLFVTAWSERFPSGSLVPAETLGKRTPQPKVPTGDTKSGKSTVAGSLD